MKALILALLLASCTSFKHEDPRWHDLKALSDVIYREAQAQKEFHHE